MTESAKKGKSIDEYEAVVTPLGSGGWLPAHDRHTASYIFQKDDLLVILDFGTGISRLLQEFDYYLNDSERIIGFISHYHLDHILGLFYLPAVIGDIKLELYAPGIGIYDKSAEEILSNILAPPAITRNINDFLSNMKVSDIPLKGMEIDGMKFSFRVQNKHIHPTVAVRIGKYVAYCTDTEPEYETINFAKNVKLLMHEVWYEEKAPEEPILSESLKEKLGLFGSEGHSSNIGVGLIAREARVGEVMTIHHNPINSPVAVHKMARAASMISAIEVEPAEDGISVNC